MEALSTFEAGEAYSILDAYAQRDLTVHDNDLKRTQKTIEQLLGLRANNWTFSGEVAKELPHLSASLANRVAAIEITLSSFKTPIGKARLEANSGLRGNKHFRQVPGKLTQWKTNLHSEVDDLRTAFNLLMFAQEELSENVS